ncbi:TonB-dependent receptor [Pseudoalteromonas sp. T1lg65]|uniref:TonB-dependent receptor n=1 Tax=Pseudoalteromonas sp. T1lg65 TaxID=2077101 RepID=UPI003F78C6AF
MPRNPFRITRLRSAVCIALSISFSQTVYAEESSDDKNKIEVIEVTATKTVTNLMKTPVAVTAMGPDSLVKQNIKEIADLNGMIPNLQLGLSTSDSGVKAAIRGVTSTNFTEIGDPAVGIHIDGIYSPRPQGSLALMFDLEQVEVLRGAQGTLFGRNSTAGVINVIPAKPEFDDNYGWSTLQLSNYSGKQLRSVYNFGISDNFALRAALMIDKRDGYINQVPDMTDRGMKVAVGDDANNLQWVGKDGVPDVDQRLNKKLDPSDFYTNSDQWGLRLTALWQVANDKSWRIGFEHYKNDGAGHVNLKDCEAAKGTRYACDSDDHFDQTVKINVPGKLDMSIDTLRSVFSWQYDANTNIEHRFAYANQKRVQFHDDDVGYHAIPEEVDISYSWGNWGRQYVDDRASYTLDSEYKSFVNELQIQQTFEQFDYVAGLFWLKEDNAIIFAQDMLVRAPWGMPYGQYYNQPKREIESKALFAQGNYHFSPDLTATLGVRYTEDERTDNDGATYGSWSADTPWYYNDKHEPLYPLGTGIAHNGTDLTFGMGPFAGASAYSGPTINTYSKSWSKTTWRAGIQYDLDAKNMVFASVATGYRPGGFGDKFDTCGGGTCVDGSTEKFSFLDYDPETTTNYELGYKGSLLDQSLNFTAVLFLTKYQDMHSTAMHAVGQKILDRECPDWDQACDVVSAWKTENIGEADIMGIELEWDYIPWENGRLKGFYAWLDTEITSYDTYNDNWICGYREEFGAEPCADLFVDSSKPHLSGRRLYDVTGNQLPNSPEHSIGLTYSHYIELPSGLTLEPWLSVRWQDTMYFTPRNLDNKVVGDYQDAYTNINAAIKLSSNDADWYVELYGTNLGDEVVKNWMGQAANGGYQFNSYNPPRMYGVRFNLSY